MWGTFCGGFRLSRIEKLSVDYVIEVWTGSTKQSTIHNSWPTLSKILFLPDVNSRLITKNSTTRRCKQYSVWHFFQTKLRSLVVLKHYHLEHLNCLALFDKKRHFFDAFSTQFANEHGFRSSTSFVWGRALSNLNSGALSDNRFQQYLMELKPTSFLHSLLIIGQQIRYLSTRE